MRNLLLLFSILYIFTLSAQTEKSEKYKEFDFWIGSWKVYKTNTDSLLGYSKVSSILDGYAIKENYESIQGNYQGTSLTKYNHHKDKWEQFWVDNYGITLTLSGHLEGNRMALQSIVQDSVLVISKISWEKSSDGSIRQIWEKSEDHGVNWEIMYDKEYRKRGY